MTIISARARDVPLVWPALCHPSQTDGSSCTGSRQPAAHRDPLRIEGYPLQMTMAGDYGDLSYGPLAFAPNQTYRHFTCDFARADRSAFGGTSA